MTFRIISAALVAMAGVAGCSVLTDFTGLTGSGDDAGAMEAGADAGADSSSDAGQADSATDSATTDDAGFDAAPVDAGAWAFVSSAGNTVGMSPITVGASASVLAGDLVIIGCDSSKTSDVISFSGFSASDLPLTVTPVAMGASYEAVAAWGIAKQRIDGLMVTATAQVPGQFMDCYINTYRGGTVATQVDHFVTMGTGPGLVSCHSVATVRGGVAYYMAARSSCAGIPSLPFVQLDSLNGNPNGNFVPADGTMVGTQLADCSGSTGDWTCLIISLSP